MIYCWGCNVCSANYNYYCVFFTCFSWLTPIIFIFAPLKGGVTQLSQISEWHIILIMQHYESGGFVTAKLFRFTVHER